MKEYIFIDQEKCIGCKMCNEVCTRKLFNFNNKKASSTATWDNCMRCNLCVAICPTEAVSCDSKVKPIPYSKEKMSVNSDNLLSLMQYRRTMRKYTGEQVRKEDLEKVIKAAEAAPKGNNRNCFRYIIIQENVEEYRKAFMKALKDLAATLPPDSKLISANTPEERETKRKRMGAFYDDYMEKGVDKLTFKAPCLVIILANKDMGGRPLWDSGITSAYMELEATSLGMGLCYLGFAMSALENNKELQEKLGMKENEMPAAIFTLGYPGFKYLRTAPREAADVKML